jgi:hypothetical protein
VTTARHGVYPELQGAGGWVAIGDGNGAGGGWVAIGEGIATDERVADAVGRLLVATVVAELQADATTAAATRTPTTDLNFVAPALTA